MGEKSKFKRVVIKIGGEAFSKNRSDWFNISALNFLAEEIRMAYSLCSQIVIVPGGGNLARGKELINLGLDRRTADQNGMLATCLNGVNLRTVLEKKGLPVRLQTAIEMKLIGEPHIPLRTQSHLEKGRVVIIAGGLGIPEFTTDTAAVVRASEIKADVILKATNVMGIFERDPNCYDNSKFFPAMTFEKVNALKIKVFDPTDIAKAQEASIPIIVFQITAGNLAAVLKGEPIGTLIASKEIIKAWRSECVVSENN